MKQYNITECEKAIKAYKEHYRTEEIDVANLIRSGYVNQLKSCQAWIISDHMGNVWLQSYNTIVSVRWADSGKFERLGRWSVTTSKQQTFFERG